MSLKNTKNSKIRIKTSKETRDTELGNNCRTPNKGSEFLNAK